MKNNIAIYCLYDIFGKIKYVGKTKNLRRRFSKHCKEKDWVVGIRVLQWCNINNWDNVEKEWIAVFPKLENKTSGGGSKWEHTIESKIKMSLAQIGNTKAVGKRKSLSDSTKEKIRKANLGRKRIFSEEHKQNISLARKGIKFSEEHLLNLKISRNKRMVKQI